MADFSDVSESTSRVDFDQISPPQNPDPNSRPGTEGFGSDQSDLNYFFYEYEDEQMSFVTDLFRTRHHDGESEVIRGFGSSDGLRVVDMDSESDSEAMEVDYSGAIREIENENEDDLGSLGFWDCLQYDNNQREISSSEEFEWEEVNLRENLSSLIDRIEQLSFSSSVESPPFVAEDEEDEENARNVEWQVLLSINNLDIGSGYDEYNVQFGELVGDSTVRGSPPAAKSAVESLQEDVLKSNVVCAVCKDEMPSGLNVTKLPCSHHYHRDCILPWLAIRNTCPLCRHELPTDDADYERRKNHTVDR